MKQKGRKYDSCTKRVMGFFSLKKKKNHIKENLGSILLEKFDVLSSHFISSCFSIPEKMLYGETQDWLSSTSKSIFFCTKNTPP